MGSECRWLPNASFSWNLSKKKIGQRIENQRTYHIDWIKVTWESLRWGKRTYKLKGVRQLIIRHLRIIKWRIRRRQWGIRL